MFKVQQNRYLWVHLVGLAAVPLLLDICLAGLASAGPALPFKFQFWAIALICIAPSAWMQIQRPFYIYSLPPLAVKPSALSEDDRRCLTVLKSWQIKALAGLTAIFSLWLLSRLYDRLPQILPVMEPSVGLASAVAAFFFACLFLQISVSVVRSLLIGQDTLQRVKPIETSEIAASFFIPGLRVNKILPAARRETEKPTATSTATPDRSKQVKSKQTKKQPVEKQREKEQIAADSIAAKPTEIEAEKAVADILSDVEKTEAVTADFSSEESDNSDQEIVEQDAQIVSIEETNLAEDADEKAGEKTDENALSLKPSELSEKTLDPIKDSVEEDSAEEDLIEEDLIEEDSSEAGRPVLEDPPLIPELIDSDEPRLNDGVE